MEALKENDWYQQLSALLDPVGLGAQTQLQSSQFGTPLMNAPRTLMPKTTTTAATCLLSSSTPLPVSSPVKVRRRRRTSQKPISLTEKRQTRATTLITDAKPRRRSHCKSKTAATITIAPSSVSAVLTTTQASLQTSAASSTTTSQAPATLTSSRIPISIDILAYVGTVFDTIFAPLIDGSSPMHQSIRQVLFKKLLLDHASQEMLSRSILSFEDLQTFILDILRDTSLIP